MTEAEELVQACVEAERETFGQRTVFERLAILTYELGQVARSVVHGESSTDAASRYGLTANALVELADLQCQVAMLHHDLTTTARELGVRYTPPLDALLVDGAERQIERMQEWRQRRTG